MSIKEIRLALSKEKHSQHKLIKGDYTWLEVLDLGIKNIQDNNLVKGDKNKKEDKK